MALHLSFHIAYQAHLSFNEKTCYNDDFKGQEPHLPNIYIKESIKTVIPDQLLQGPSLISTNPVRTLPTSDKPTQSGQLSCLVDPSTWQCCVLGSVSKGSLLRECELQQPEIRRLSGFAETILTCICTGGNVYVCVWGPV